jgi:putative transposase
VATKAGNIASPASANRNQCSRPKDFSRKSSSVAAVCDRRSNSKFDSLTQNVPERLRRLESTVQRFPIYFITTCTKERRPILNKVGVHSRLIQFGNEGESRGAWGGAYVLIPDHLHAFVALDEERLKLSAWIKSLKNALSKTLGSQHVMPPHWKKGFFDHVLRSGDSYSEKWDYVRENPVRTGLAKDWRAWPFLGEVFDLEFEDDQI